MSSDANLAISARSVGKTYQIRSVEERPTTLGEAVVERLRHPLRRATKEQFRALHDVSFDLHRGETLGIIGRNGAGKSTLLKIISRVTEPTAGEVDLFGKVGSLLEVGTGFHPELTGRENIFLNGAILGLTKQAIRRQFDSIVEFAEIGPFLDTPVKRYSSGMYVRLAFAVAAHLDPEILVVDEVLAVGDFQFQQKCLGKMGEVTAREGRAVLFVSHNMTAVRSICNRCLVLQEGRVTFEGPPEAAVEHYLTTARGGKQEAGGSFELAHPGEGGILRRLEVQDSAGQPTGSVAMGDGLQLVIHVDELSLSRMVAVRITTDDGTLVVGVHNQLRPLEVKVANRTAEQVVASFGSLPLLPGRYWIDVVVSEGRKGKSVVESVERAGFFDVTPTDLYESGWQVQRGARFGLLLADPRWEMRQNGTILASSVR